MTEPDTLPPELDIQFKGRTLWVRMPTPEQLLVWRRTLRKLEGVTDGGDWNAEQVMNALERARSIVDSTLVNAPDVDWLDDEMLAKRADLKDVVEIIQMTVDRFAEAAQSEGNRETRRAAKKASGKKAARKAPARKASRT